MIVVPQPLLYTTMCSNVYMISVDYVQKVTIRPLQESVGITRALLQPRYVLNIKNTRTIAVSYASASVRFM